MLAPALVGILLAAPPAVEYQALREGSRDHVPAALAERLAAANGPHITDCQTADVAWVEFDLGGPEGDETVVASYRDGLGLFGPRGQLYGRILDEGLPCGQAASIQALAVVRLPGAPPAVLLVIRDDTGQGREVFDGARLFVFHRLRLRLAWERKVQAGERFEIGALAWDGRVQKFHVKRPGKKPSRK